MVTEISILLAKIFSLAFLSIGIGGILNKDYFKKIMDGTFQNAGLTFFLGFFTLVSSFLIVNYHNIWVKDWAVIITIFGWAGLLKGFALMAFPESLSGTSKKLFASNLFRIIPYTSLLIGLILGYFGFIA